MRKIRLLAACFSVLTVLALVLAACGGDEEAPASAPRPTSAPTQAPAATATAAPAATATAIPSPTPTRPPAPTATPTPVQPRRGGVLAWRLNRDPINWDPHLIRSADTLFRSQALWNNLIRTSAYNDSVLEPDLAESYQLGSDGKTWTFKIRQGVKFHDGAPMTVDDVVHSFDRIMKPTATYKSWMNELMKDVDTVKAIDAGTVQVTLKRASPSFQSILSLITMVVAPKHIGEGLDKKPIGTGPFVLKSSQASVSQTFDRNPAYHAAGLPYLDQVIIRIIVDDGTALAAFRTGQMQWTGIFPQIVTPGNSEQLKADVRGVQIMSYGGGGGSHVFFNQVEPFTSPDVRRALHLAIDRVEFNQVAFAGGGNPYVGDMPSGGKFGLRAEDLRSAPGWRLPKDQDRAEARRLLEQAGYTRSNPLKVVITVQDAFQNEATVVAEHFRTVGVDATLEVLDRATVTQRLANRAFRAYYVGIAASIDDPSGLYPSFLLPGGASNWAKYDLADVNRLYAEQDTILDDALRVQKVRELQLKTIELAWYPPVAERYVLHAVRPEVQRFPSATGSAFSNRYRFEQAWLAQ